LVGECSNGDTFTVSDSKDNETILTIDISAQPPLSSCMAFDNPLEGGMHIEPSVKVLKTYLSGAGPAHHSSEPASSTTEESESTIEVDLTNFIIDKGMQFY